LWSREYNRDESDVLKLESDVARAVADEIRIQVTPEERARLAAARNINPEAHDAYLLGQHHLRSNEEDLRQAIEHFERAIQLSPEYAAAYVGLSNAWRMRGRFGAKDIKEVLPAARDAAVKAVTLDPQLAEAHVALSIFKRKDWKAAEEELIRALELDPNSAEAHERYADLLMALERRDEAIREIERAEQLDPRSSDIQSRYCRVLYRARKYDEAVPHLKRAIELDPDPGNSMPYWIGAELYAEMGRYDDALVSLKTFQSHDGSVGALSTHAAVARVCALMGKKNEARRMLAELKATTDPASFSDIPVARAYAALGDKDEAFKVLFRLVDERENYATYVKADPPFESLHSDKRWNGLLRRMNLPPEDSGK
jgi:tetratricopeptide (TPR) repeat protein